MIYGAREWLDYFERLAAASKSYSEILEAAKRAIDRYFPEAGAINGASGLVLVASGMGKLKDGWVVPAGQGEQAA